MDNIRFFNERLGESLMDFKIRLLDLPKDYTSIANLINLFNKELRRDLISATDLQEEDKRIPSKDNTLLNESNLLTGFCRNRIVAIDDNQKIIGYASAWRAPWTEPGVICSTLIVSPENRNKRVGKELLNHLECWGREMKADFLISEVPDHLTDSVSFIEMNGYKKERHVWQSTLDLSTFDEKINGSIVDDVNISGIRFVSLSELEVINVKTPLYELFKQTVKDNPAMNDDVNSLPSLEDWSNEFLDNSNIAIIAFSESRMVGMTILIPKADGELYNEWTGVDKDFRGKKIALALKLKSIQMAKASSYYKMRTDNDSLNTAMISVNQKLGYIPVAGGHFVVSKNIKAKSKIIS